jgi:6-phosphogluconolactonase (cycloisomerase 2 family)
MSTHPRRRFGRQLAALSAAAISAPALARGRGRHDTFGEGKIFTSTNATAGNELLVFEPTQEGELALIEHVATGGQGTGAGLGSQGAVTLSANGRYLFVVNALGSTVSTFELGGNGLHLASVVHSGGSRPISVAEHDGLVCVLNAGDPGHVALFRNVRGGLVPLPDGVRGLSASGGTAPGQVRFSSDGDVLVVTERATHRITSYPVGHGGSLGAMIVTPSSGPTPFGFAFDRRNHLIVSEAPMSSASSYRFSRRAPAVPVLVSGSVPNGQAAACWVAVTPNGRVAFTANAGTSSISSYRVLPDGRIRLANPMAGSTGPNAGALDIAVSPGGRRLYALASRALQIVAFRVDYEGELEPLGAGSGLPPGSAGVAAN